MAFGRPNSPQNTSKTARSGFTECRNFYLVTVTGSLCQSVELIQRVTVTGECQIDRNGTVDKGCQVLKYNSVIINYVGTSSA